MAPLLKIFAFCNSLAEEVFSTMLINHLDQKLKYVNIKVFNISKINIKN